MAKAFQLVDDEHKARVNHLEPLRDHLIGFILEEVPDSRLTGHPVKRLPNHASFAFKDVNANTLLMLLDIEGFACSSGSACKTGDPRPSEVLTTIGFSPDWALGSLRITLGKDTYPEEVEKLIDLLPVLIDRARRLS